jgi:hypothetical protein
MTRIRANAMICRESEGAALVRVERPLKSQTARLRRLHREQMVESGEVLVAFLSAVVQLYAPVVIPDPGGEDRPSPSWWTVRFPLSPLLRRDLGGR